MADFYRDQLNKKNIYIAIYIYEQDNYPLGRGMIWAVESKNNILLERKREIKSGEYQK